MADVYYDNGASGLNNGTSKTDAYTSLKTAVESLTAGDYLWCSHTSAESLTPGTAYVISGPLQRDHVFMISVDFSGSTPPVEADYTRGCSFSITDNNTLRLSEAQLWWGFDFTALSLIAGGNVELLEWKDCTYTTTRTNGDPITGTDQTQTAWKLSNCSMEWTNENGEVRMGGNFEWADSNAPIMQVASPGIVPNLIAEVYADYTMAQVILRGLDLSLLSASGEIVNCSRGGMGGHIYLQAIKIPNGAVPSFGVTADSALIVDFDAVDDGTEVFQHGRYTAYGSQVVETTVVRTGGASDGTTLHAWRIATTTESTFLKPFICRDILFWNDTVGSITVTVYGTWASAALPNNDDIWFEARYLGADVQEQLQNVGMDNVLDTPVALSADGASVWGDGGSPTPAVTNFSMAATFSPGLKGWVRLQVKAAAPSTTFYIDPKAVIT